jgi:putative ABC transport system ATP-binding protein
MTAVVEFDSVTRRFGQVTALDAVSGEIRPGELTVVAGPSGSGKTTLLYVVAGHERPDGGQVRTSLDRTGRDLGFVPQALALMEELSIRENVELPAMLRAGTGYPTDELLGTLEIAHLADRLPAEVSGGEQQRTAIARALRLSPALLLADEPTGHQDPTRVQLIIDLFRRHARAGNTLLVSSHDREVIDSADRVLTLSGGRLT